MAEYDVSGPQIFFRKVVPEVVLFFTEKIPAVAVCPPSSKS